MTLCAYCIVQQSTAGKGMSAVYMVYNVVEREPPWGTPYFDEIGGPVWLPIRILANLLSK